MTIKTEPFEITETKEKSFLIKIELLSGPMDGLEFKIKKDIVTIGREKDNEIPIPLDIIISRSHARITNEDGEYWLEDLGSKNGTFIKDKMVKGKVKLPPETIFKLGVSEMRLTGLGNNTAKRV